MRDWKQFVRKRLNLNRISPTREAELIEDISQQLEDVFQESLKRGFSEAEANAIAEQHISDWSAFAQDLTKAHRRRGLDWSHVLPDFLQDFLFGLRMLRKNPRFTLIASLTIALGIGATTAIFSVIYGVILQPLPYQNPDRILWVWGKFSQGNRAAISPPDFLDYRSQSKSFETLAAMHVMHQFVSAPVTLNAPSGPVTLDSAAVSSGFFEVFGIQPLLGRTFQRSDERESAKIVILSHSAWQQHFGGDPDIAGKSIMLDRLQHTVLGVVPEGFRFPVDAEIWMPLSFLDPGMDQRQFHFLRPIGRLREGVSAEQTEAELGTIAAQLETQYPETNKTWGVRLQSLQQYILGDVHTPLFVIFGAVLFLLLIACVNVTNLQLAKTTARHKEIAIRAAMGAGRRRIVRQLLAESLLLCLPAGVVGLFLAYWSLNAFRAVSPDYIPRLQEVSVNAGTLLFTLSCSIITAVLVGLIPAYDALPHISAERLKESRFTGTRTAAGRLRNILAIAQIALSLVLLAGAGLMLKSFWNLTNVDLGFQPNNLLTVRLTLNYDRYPDVASVIAFTEAALDNVRGLPGVESVASGTGLPLVPAGGDRFFTIDGQSLPSNDAEKPNAQFRVVSEDYFSTLGIQLLRGRNFSSQDHETSEKVVIVNDVLSKKYFGSDDALGKWIRLDMEEPFHARIVGIVQGARQNLGNPPDPEMYLLYKQSPMGYMLLVARASTGAFLRAETIQGALRKIDPDLAFRTFRTMEEIKAQLAVRNRLNAILLTGAATIALMLAAVGIFGVLSFSVEQRKQEIGIRLALGAQRQSILTLILRHGIHLAVVGLGIGITGALLLTRYMRSLLFEVSPQDPLILGAVSLLLSLVAIVACILPAFRATRTDPLRTLRFE